MPCLAVSSGVNTSCRGIHLSVTGGFVKMRACRKNRLLQFSEYFPSLTNEAAAHESQKMGTERQKENTVLLLHCFLPQVWFSSMPHLPGPVRLLASLPLHVLSRFLLSDSSIQGYHLVSVVLLFYHFICFPHRASQ